MDTNTNTGVKKKEPEFYNTLHVTPLVEIFNISVHGNVNKHFGIYGEISVTDRGHTFSIYKRTKDSPQFMASGDKLLLTVADELDNAVIIPSEYVSLNVNLFAISGHDEITLQGKISLDRTPGLDDWSEEYKTEKIAENKNWNAEVQYAIFPYAVAATVRVMHFSKDDDFDTCVVLPNDNYCSECEDDNDCYDSYYETEEYELVDKVPYYESEEDEPVDDVPYYESEEDEPVDKVPYIESEDELDVTHYEKNNCSDITTLYGSVSAYAAVCGDNGQRSSLFNKGVQDCVQVQSGRYIELSRSVVAVPAYSSLKIEVKFFDGDSTSQIANDTIKFKPVDNWSPYKKDIATDNGRIRVQVFWSHAYYQLYEGMEDSTTTESSDDDSQTVMSERPSSATSDDDSLLSSATSDDDCLPEHNSSETVGSNWVLPSSSCTERLLEVFSVVVCSKDSKPFKFYGSISLAHATFKYLFKTDESSPIDCLKSGMPVIHKSLEFNDRYSLFDNFGLIVDMKDASSQAAISRGLIAFHILNLDLLANRRICSLIRGELGFAVVHYSIFPKGVPAIVEIKPSDKCPPVIIKGKIYARYDNCEPGRCYKDEFFKNLLFSDEDDGVQLNDPKHTLPLLKPYLALPIKSILVIEADLQISTVDGRVAEGKGEIVFFNNETSSQEIGNSELCLDVSVHFHPPR